MKNKSDGKIKRTRWEATNKAIRQILIDCYVKSPAFKIFEELLESLMTFDNPNHNKKLRREFEENPINYLPQNDFLKQEDQDKINVASYVLNKAFWKAFWALTNPLQKEKWDLTIDSYMILGNWEKTTKRPLNEIKEKYGISYPTLKNRLPLFFEIETISKWKSHFKYLCPKREVLQYLARYFAERKLLKNKKGIYAEIVDLFKNEEI